MPETFKEQIASAEAAIEFAQSVRRIHRRKTERGSPQREQDIETALDRLKAAMGPLRTIIGGFPYGPPTAIAEDRRNAVRDASAAVQAERRKLWKMKER